MACHKGNDSAGTYLIQSLCKKVIVNRKIQPVVAFISHFIISEGYISHRQIKEIPAVCCLESRHGNISQRIKLLRNPSGNRIQLYSVKPALTHRLRKHSEEIPNPHRRL